MLPLFLVGWLAGALSLGISLAPVCLRGEKRAAVLVSYGLVSGFVVQGLLLVLLWRWLPLGTGYFVVVACSLVCAILVLAGVRPFPARRELRWGLSARDTAISIVLLGIFSFLGHRVVTIGYSFGDPELLWLHSSITERMTRTLYPVMSAVEPDDILRYRFAFHALAAAIQSDARTLSPEALAGVAAMTMPIMFVALTGASLRFLRTPGPGMLAAFFGLFGGSLLPYYLAGKPLVTGQPFAGNPADLVTGVVWHGNTLDMLHINPTIAIGFATFLGAAWLVAEALDQDRGAWPAFLVASASLGYLGLVNEVHFAVLAAGTVACPIAASLGPARGATKPSRGAWLLPLAMVGIAFLLVSSRGGLAGGISLFGAGSGSMRMVPNLDHFGQVVVPPRGGSAPWVPLFSLETQLDTVLAVVGIPLLTFIAWVGRDRFVLRLALCACAAIVPWLTLYSARVPADTFRLGQAALTLFLTLLPLVLWRLKPGKIDGRAVARLAPSLAILAAALVTAPHLAAAVAFTALPPAPALRLDGNPNIEAAAYLRSEATAQRILVPLETPAGDNWALYAPSGPGAAMRELLAFSGLSVPIGHTGHAVPSHVGPDAYLPLYRRASFSFDEEALSRLKIDWVFVLPSYLTPVQEEALARAQAEGRLTLQRSFGQEGTHEERLLFRHAVP